MENILLPLVFYAPPLASGTEKVSGEYRSESVSRCESLTANTVATGADFFLPGALPSRRMSLATNMGVDSFCGSPWSSPPPTPRSSRPPSLYFEQDKISTKTELCGGQGEPVLSMLCGDDASDCCMRSGSCSRVPSRSGSLCFSNGGMTPLTWQISGEVSTVDGDSTGRRMYCISPNPSFRLSSDPLLLPPAGDSLGSSLCSSNTTRRRLHWSSVFEVSVGDDSTLKTAPPLSWHEVKSGKPGKFGRFGKEQLKTQSERHVGVERDVNGGSVCGD
ncbi:hypothetical protein ERJ75_000058200 [Trypanosoma vivax]|nr:hypothetical protein TRVL_02209 [Trypanosoma vivax]KAH8620746.1 hypothetical protein ERJ75_000058200 [Trypanosoma vivax]